MVAASPPCSNVPPDHLQAAPALVSGASFADQLCKLLSIFCSEAEPGNFWQHDTAANECCRNPTTVRRLQSDGAIMLNPNALAALIPFRDNEQLADIYERPCAGGDDAPQQRDRQRKQQEKADASRDNSAAQDKAPQARVRLEFGRVCVR